MKRSIRFGSLLCVLLLAAAVAFWSGPACAVITWDGVTGTDWDTSADPPWSGGVKPAAADTALFNTILATVANATADQSVGSISFDTAAGTASGTFTIGATGGNKFTLSNNGSIQILSSLTGTGKTITINSLIVLTPDSGTTAGAYAFNNDNTDATNTLNFGGAISSGTTNNTETLTLNGANTGNNSISGIISNGSATTFAVTKSGAGTWTLSNANTYNDATTINAGTLKLGATGSGANTPLGTTAAGTTVSATGAALDLGGFTLSAAEPLSITGTGVGTTGALTNSGAAATYSGAVTIAAASTSIGGTGDITLSTALVANANSFVKVGADKLTLQAASTRTGATQIDNGTLRIENITAFGTTAAAITINAGTLEIGTATTVANGTGTITLNNGGTISDGLAGTAARIDKTINVQASGTAVVSFDSGANAANVLTINGGGNTRLTGGATGAKIQIKGSGTVDVGDGGNTRTSNVIADWYLQSGKLQIRADSELGNVANDLYFQGGTLITGAAFTLANGHVLDFSNASGGTVDTTGGNLTLGTAGQLTGANRLTKAGANVLILSAANAGFSGEVNITGGAVRANDGTGVNSGSLLTLNGGVFETGANLARTGGSSAGNMQITGGTSGFSAQGGAVQVAFGTLVSPTALTWGTAPFAPTTLNLNASTANNTLEFKNAIDLGASARTVQVDANVATMSGILSGTGGGLTKTGAGTLVLSNNNSYDSITTINVGTLQANHASALGIGGDIKFTGGKLQYTAASAGQDWATRFKNSTSAISLDVNGQTVTLAGSIPNGNSGGLTLSGTAGTLVLSGAANAYTGATTVNVGTLRSGASDVLPDGSAVTVSGIGSLTATLDLAGNSDTIGTLSFGGSTTSSGSAVTTGAGTLTLGGDVTYANANNPLGATISGKLDLGSATRTFTVNDSTTAANDLTVSANISGTGVGLTKAGTGVMLLSGTNSYTGVTTINAGMLKAATPAALYNDTGDMSTWTLANITVNNTGTLAVNYGGGGTDLTQTQVGTVLTNLTTSINNNGLKAGSAFGFDTTNATSGATYGNAIADSTGTGGGAIGLTKLGANTLTLSGASTYTGPTTVTTGILKAGIASVLNTSGAFGNNSAVTLANTAGVALDIAGYDTQIGSLAGGSGSGGNVTLGSNTLTVGGNNTTTTYTGVISSSAGVTGVSLNKIGTGYLTLQGANTYTGKTVIDGGRLYAKGL